jgi:hypothetical protein
VKTKAQQRARRLRWEAANRETLQAKKAAYIASHKKEKAAYDAARYASNRAATIARTAAYAAAHPEKAREWSRKKSRKWALANPEKCRAQRQLRRATKLGQTPPWACPVELEDFEAGRWFAEAFLGGPVHLGHGVPLKAYGYIDGKWARVASGLHCVANLIWQTTPENLGQYAKLDAAVLHPVNAFET